MKINQAYQVSPIYVFFLIHSAQFGAGVLGYSRIIAKKAGYDGWIGVVLAGFLHILMWMMYRMLSWVKGSILKLQTYMFGGFIGTCLNFLFLVYFFIVSASILRTYIEIVQVWMFPTASTLILAIILSILVYYIISSGFRVMTAICIASIFVSIFYAALCVYCLGLYGHWEDFTPILNHSYLDIADAMHTKSVYTMAGSEIILMIFPFLHTPKESHKFAQYGLLFSNLLYVLTFVSALACFNEQQLSHLILSQLSLSQVITFPFLQRFETLMVSTYAWQMVTSIILPLWACTRGMREIAGLRQRYTLLILLGLNIIIACLLQDRHSINTFITQTSRFTFYLIYIYIPILFLLFCLKTQYQKKENTL
jgi:spore germination protein (amino acid permease)